MEIVDLTVAYGDVRALDGVGFRTNCGNCLALLGPNGAGKSTLLKSVAGLLRPEAGRVWWRGAPSVRAAHEIAYLAQRSEVDWQFPLTVRGLVEMGRFPHIGWWRRFGNRDDDVVDRALAAMRLEDLAGRQISALSGGQQQRAFVARALAQEAHVLLLDEPFGGLDRPSQELLADLLRDLAAGGRLVIASHHDLENVREIFDQVVLLNRQLVSFGNVDDEFTPVNLEACFGAMNLYRQSAGARGHAGSRDGETGAAR